MLTIIHGHLVIEPESQRLCHPDRRSDLEPARIVASGSELVEPEQEMTLAPHERDGRVSGRRRWRRLARRRFGEDEEVRRELGIVFGCGRGRVRVQVAQWGAEPSGEGEDAGEELFRRAVVVDLVRQARAVDKGEGVVAARTSTYEGVAQS